MMQTPNSFSWIGKIFLAGFLFLACKVFPQLSVTPSGNANTLAQIIGGTGVTVTNASLSCGANGAGSFTYSGANLGMSSGIVLTTGSASQASGAGGGNVSVSTGNDYTDPNLSAIESNAHYDNCILEFDFVPVCGSINITFVFGSEEYPEFVGAGYNDAFGIFLTGPNPAGGNYSGSNIATLPNGTPVSIDNVNGSTNTSYFHNNYTSPNSDIEYDGYTVPITSTYAVKPCSTYHMKIGIADAGDGLYDSGVFVGNDAISCTTSPVASTTVTPATCVGNNGAAGVTVTSYTGTPTYSWSPGGQTTASIGGLSPGTYTCVVGFGSGCGTITQTVTATVTQTGVPVTITVNSPTYCAGGSAVLNASGASTYTWSPATGLSSTNGASVTANPAVTTVYTVTGTSSGCNGSNTSTVTVNPTPTVSVNSATICPGGSAALSASGAITYSWSPATGLSATTGANVTASPAATTTYTITGTTGSCVGTNTCTVTVSPSPTVTVNSATICRGTSTTLTANGATTYSWSPATGLSATTGASVTANPTVTTTYTIVGTTGTCTSSITSTVTVNPTPTVTVNSATTCPGATATLTANGANTYTWTPSATLSSSTGAVVTANPTVTTTYTITGTSAAGCTATATSTVTVSGSITPTASSATICAGGSATLTASGATTYTWTPSSTLSSSTGASVTANPTVTTTYSITAASGGCTGTTTAMVTVSPMPTITVNSPSMCVGNSTTLNASGATNYSWSPSTGLSATTGASATANPTVTTTYTITGADAGGCVSTNTSTVTINPLPVITVNNGFVCNGSSATLTANGATTYAWSPGTGLSATTGSTVTASPASTTQYTITGTDANGCVNSDTTTVTVISNPTVTVLPATICNGSSTTLTATGASTYVWSPGTGLSSTSGSSVTANPATTTVYTITGTAGTCTAVTTTTVNVNPLPVVIVGSNSPVCVNQALNLNSSGGISYSWNGPNSFSSTSQNPSISPATQAATGVYTVTVTDANTCVNSGTVSATVNPLPVVTATGATVCIGSTINLSCTPANASSYSWSNPTTGYSSNQQNPSIPNATANMAGSYVVTVTDNNGCASGNVASVQVNPSLAIIAGSNSAICENATLNLTSNNGVTWSWSGPGGFTSFSQNPSIPSAQLTASGTYVVTGTDANGCQGTDSVVVTINPLPTITATSGTICAAQQTANLNASGAVTYTWSPSATLNSSAGANVTANPMTTTMYTLVGSDANGCVNFGVTTVFVNQLPTVSSNSGVICVGNTTTLNASGASTYTWSPATGLSSANGSSVSANPSATIAYTVTGTDIKGCYNTGTCTVTVNPLPVVNVNSSTVCSGVTATLTAIGANTYNWSPTAGLNASTGAAVLANPGSSSSYVVTGTDINGCVNTATTVVTVNPLPVVDAGQSHSGCSPVCVSLANSTTATGTCSWNFGDGTNTTNCIPSHCYTGQGTFNTVLTLTDANGCVGKDTVVISVYPVPDADFIYNPIPASILESTINFADNSSGAVISTWQWTFGDPGNHGSSIANPSFYYSNAGTYPTTLVVTTNYGCTDSVTKYVVIGGDFSIYIPNAFTPNYDGTNDVFMAKAEGVKDFNMYIFDRWGNQVFFSDDLYKGWDGRFQSKGDNIVQEDVYVWKIELKNYKGEAKQLKGTVTLLK